MEIKTGKCTNIDDSCSVALGQRPVKIEGTREFVCPECGEPLLEIKIPEDGNWKKALIAFGFLLVIGLGSWYFYSDFSSIQTSKIADSTIKKEDSVVVISQPKADIIHKPVPPKPAVVPPQTPTTKKVYPAAGELIKGSEECDVCTHYYKIHDGKGGKITRKEEDSDECCKCGETITDQSGYTYRIDCENGVKKVKLLSKK